jgi:hypothetical protein
VPRLGVVLGRVADGEQEGAATLAHVAHDEWMGLVDSLKFSKFDFSPFGSLLFFPCFGEKFKTIVGRECVALFTHTVLQAASHCCF